MHKRGVLVQVARKQAAKAAELEEDALIVEYLRQRQVKEQVRQFAFCSRLCQAATCSIPDCSCRCLRDTTSTAWTSDKQHN